jgi:DNA-binding Lrp family transcriptional regulator
MPTIATLQQNEPRPLDLRILRELQADASLSNVALAQRVGLSPSPCLARVKALEREGVIRQVVALLDAKRWACTSTSSSRSA